MALGPERCEEQWRRWASKRHRRGAQNGKDKRTPGNASVIDNGHKGTPGSRCPTNRSSTSALAVTQHQPPIVVVLERLVNEEPMGTEEMFEQKEVPQTR